MNAVASSLYNTEWQRQNRGHIFNDQVDQLIQHAAVPLIQMAAHGTGQRLSRLYESEPMYVTDQPLFLNAVGEISSGLSPQEMLSAVHEIEKALGRDRSGNGGWDPGPRISTFCSAVKW